MVPLGDIDSLDAWLGGARVLVIDDEPANLQFLRHVLATEGYGELVTLADSAAAVERFLELDPDLVIVDLMMPGLDGFEVIARVQALSSAGTYLPILVATADHAPATRRRALAAGARDFLTKPLSPAEVRLRVRNLLETRFLHEQLRGSNVLLEQRVTERTHELEEARLEILLRLARAGEFRDDQTGQHTLRVGRMAARLGEVLGLAGDVCELIGRAAPLHDIGKIGIPDAILLKPDRLDDAEFVTMRTHTVIGANILAGSRIPVLQLAEEIALSHHEHWDGHGYPRRLAGESIPAPGRIVAVADVFDSLTHERPYKRAWTVDEALAEIAAQAGRQFDPAVVAALMQIVEDSGLPAVSAAAPRPARSARKRRTAAAAPAPMPARAAPTVAAGLNGDAAAPLTPELAAMATRLQAAEAERDALVREVERLRAQIARRDARSQRTNRTALPS